MSFKTLLIEIDQNVAVIRMNRPKQLNALSSELVQDLNDAFDQLAADANVRAIVLTGEGRGFSSGADLMESTTKPPLDAEGKLDIGLPLVTGYNPLIQKMRGLSKPVIAAVNGMAAGAGCSIALMADLTIAARSAKFLQAFVNIGLIPDAGGTWILPRAAGPQRAMGMAMLGEKISAEQARDWGLIWDVVDDEQLMPAALALAQKLAQGPGVAIGLIKRSIYAASVNDLGAQLDLERNLQRDCGRTSDFMEGVMAFAQKRKANFKGR